MIKAILIIAFAVLVIATLLLAAVIAISIMQDYQRKNGKDK